MRHLLTIVTLILLSSWTGKAFAQRADSSANFRVAELPPLMDLIDSALRHNALVKAGKDRVDLKQANLLSQRDNWTKNIGLQADTRYGTFDNFATSVSGPSTSLVSSTTKQWNYGVGFFVKMPLFDVISRKNQISMANAELNEASHISENQQDVVRQLVIRQYQELLLKQKIVNIRSANLGTSKVNMLMIEKEFRNGVIPITEYVRVSDIVSGSRWIMSRPKWNM